MNEEYLNGLQDASIDVLLMGSVFAEGVIKKLKESSYSDGYLKGYNLMLERGKILQPSEESLKIKTKHPGRSFVPEASFRQNMRTIDAQNQRYWSISQGVRV